MSKSADAFRTISEVADWLGIPAHVLRFWESKFTQVKPVKRAGGRRYYRPADMQLLGGIRKLLHDEGMTIKGVQKMMRERGVRHVASMSPPLDPDLEEAIADIALDVTEEEEPRGTVLNFDRTKDEGQENTPPQAEASEAEASATSVQDAREDEAAPSRTTAAPDDTDAPALPEDPVPNAPEIDQTPPPPVAKPAQPEVTGAAQADNDSKDAVADESPARAPRVADVTVPDDPPDDAPSPASPLARLCAVDPAILAAQRPALSELAGRMAELRTRMQSDAESH